MGIKTEFARVDLAAFGANDLRGTWANELGSVMTVEQVDGRGFSGKYESAVSENEKPVEGALAGTLAGEAIGFTVNWSPAFASVTSFTGKLLKAPGGTLQIYALWQLSRGVEDDADFWQSFLTGADLFTKLG